jgi:hypothetical protein
MPLPINATPVMVSEMDVFGGKGRDEVCFCTAKVSWRLNGNCGSDKCAIDYCIMKAG